MYLGNFEPEFADLLTKLHNTHNGDQLFKLSGISDELVDTNKYTSNFFNKDNSNVADLSVDSNSNIKQRSVVTYINEAPKPVFRLNNYYQLWSSLRDTKGLERANEAVKADIIGDVYIADFHLWNCPYCYAYSAMDILLRGMPFIESPKSKPAAHLDSFIQHLIQSTMYYSNSIAGAVAFPDIFPALWFVYQADKKIGYPTDDPVKFDKWVEQQFQLFVYTINQPYRSGTQSPFVNISVMDKYFLKDMFEGLTWTNPETDEFVEINLKEVDELQRKFSEWFCKESKKQIFTFPVMTCNLMADTVNGKRQVLDEEFFRWVGKVTLDRALYNVYVGKAGQLSTCLESNELIEVFEEGD